MLWMLTNTELNYETLVKLAMRGILIARFSIIFLIRLHYFQHLHRTSCYIDTIKHRRVICEVICKVQCMR